MYEIIDTDHDIPYGAGSSKDARTLFIDRRVPRYYLDDKSGKMVDVHASVEVHEFVEFVLNKRFGWVYQKSHPVAEAAETKAVTDDGNDVEQYDAFWKPLLAECLKTFSKVPRDLDLQPYLDSKDSKTLDKIKDCWRAAAA